MAKFIQSDYDTAVKCANELKTQVSALERYMDKQAGFIEASKSYWKGNSGDEAREGMAESKKRVQTIANELESLANDIVSVAKQLKAKDEELAQAVKMLGGLSGAVDKVKDWFD